jgi:hypothetical protein
MSAIIPFAAGAQMPAYMANRKVLALINKDVPSGGASFPRLSIKGKVFTLVKDGERKVLTKPAPDDDEILQSLTITAVRANTQFRAYFSKVFVEGSDEIQRPDCQSADGVAPLQNAISPQAKKCQLCPHAVWGTGNEGKGTACSVSTRLAIVDPEQIAKAAEVEPYQLNVPAASRKNFAEVVKAADSRGIPYNALALKISFDPTSASPKLNFKLVGLVDDAVYAKIQGQYESEIVKDILGLGPVRAALAAPAGGANEDDLDAALAAKAQRSEQAAAEAAQVVAKAKTPAPAAASMDDLDAMMAPVEVPAPKPKPKPAPKPAPAPAPVAAAPAADDTGGFGGLLDDLDTLLGSTDD